MKINKNKTTDKHKKTKAKINKQTVDFIPIIDIDYDNECFVTKTGYLDLLKFNCKDIHSLDEDNLNYDFHFFSTFFKLYPDDVKIISMFYPTDTSSQINYIDYKMDKTNNPIFLDVLETKKEELINLYENRYEREFYLMIFAKNKSDYIKNKQTIETCLCSSQLAENLNIDKKLQILFKINNMNTSISTTRNISTDAIESGIDEKLGYNPDLLFAIQPQGNMSFSDERITKKGDGYEACLHIYDYKSEVTAHWLLPLLNHKDTLSTVDVSTADKKDVLKNIKKSMEEQISRYASAKNRAEQLDAQDIFRQLEDLYVDMQSLSDIMKVIHTRVYIYRDTMAKLDKAIASIKMELEGRGAKSAVFLNENEYEWRSLFLSYSQQLKLPNNREGQPIPSNVLAAGHPFHFNALNDPKGFYYGDTQTGGTVIFDKFHKNKNRLSYCGIVTGDMGAGKSSLLKKLIEDDIIRGNFVRGFVTNAEFNKSIYAKGGLVINLDGSDGMLNILQVYKNSDSSEVNSFSINLSKLNYFYKCIVPSMDDYDKMTLNNLLRKLYKKHLGYDYQSEQKKPPCEQKQITGLSADNYPILSDFLAVIREEIYEDITTKQRKSNLSDEEFTRYLHIEMATDELICSFGHLFNGHSSIKDFTKEQVVFFNIATLSSQGSNIFDAQMFNAMNLLWDNMICVGETQKNLYDTGQIKEYQAVKYIIYMDEAHKFVNANKPNAVDFIDSYVRESRKYFAGIVLASQTIKDFFGELSLTETHTKLKNLFALCQYKFLMKQDRAVIPYIEQLFGKVIPANDLDNIPTFEQGQALLIIAGYQCLNLKINLSKRELALFTGGA